MAGVFGFSSEDAKRIGAVVRRVEGMPAKRELNGPNEHGPNPGVRLLLAKHESSTGWPAGSTAVVTIHAGDTIASVETMVARNQFVQFSTNTACTQRWVALGHNGFGWYVVNQQPACESTCSPDVAGVDFSLVPGYQATATQVLGHEAGCIKWLDTTTCATATAA